MKILSPQAEETIAGAALEVEARAHGAWTVAVEVEGQRVPDSKLGERRVDHKNNLATFRFVGLNVRPGPNRIKVTAVGPAGETGQSAEVTAYGRGPAKRIEIVTDKTEIAAGGRDATRVRVRAFDQWGRPAADGAVALEVTSGRLVRVEEKDAAADKGEKKDRKSPVADDEQLTNGGPLRQQMLTLTGGEGLVDLIADGEPGEAEIRATTGVLEAHKRVRVIPEVRPAILVGLAEVTIGGGAPELTERRRQEHAQPPRLLLPRAGLRLEPLHARLRQQPRAQPHRRAATASSSSTRSTAPTPSSATPRRASRTRNRTPSSTRASTAVAPTSSSATSTPTARTPGLASYNRRLTGAKLHLENAGGDFISVTGARPDTAFARDVFEGGSFTFARLSHGELLPGSETVAIEVRDRRNPDIILSRESLLRGIDYNLDPVTGEIFFLRPISTFDFQLNLVQVVATYEYRAAGMSSAVYTGRAFKTFERLGLKLGLSFVDQRQGEFGSFVVGGIDAEKTLPRRGRLSLQWATSRGRAMVGGNIFGGGTGDERHDGNAYRAELEQPLPFREATLRASFVRADEGFLNPFGQTVTPGSQRAEGSLEMKVTRTSVAALRPDGRAQPDGERGQPPPDRLAPVDADLRRQTAHDLRLRLPPLPRRAVGDGHRLEPPDRRRRVAGHGQAQRLRQARAEPDRGRPDLPEPDDARRQVPVEPVHQHLLHAAPRLGADSPHQRRGGHGLRLGRLAARDGHRRRDQARQVRQPRLALPT